MRLLVRRSLLLALFLIPSAAAAAVAYSLTPVDRAGATRIVEVPRGATTVEIGRRLHAAGVIRSPWAFSAAARVKGVAGRLHEGEYRLSPAMPLLDIVDTLARGDVVLRRVTIPEGYTAAQIVSALTAAGIGTPAGLTDLVRRGASRFPYEFLRRAPGGSLEGFLYPDTYFIPRHLADYEVVTLLLARFADVVLPRYRAAEPALNPSGASGSGRSLFDVVIVASLVEREAKVPAERALIAGVLYNRLAKGMRLEVDATVLYALGRHKETVTFDDLAVDSPYNTYRHAGLPPGPIANPGLASIMAALQPARTPYLFYVARADGSHVFSRTLNEHLTAIRKYRGK